MMSPIALMLRGRGGMLTPLTAAGASLSDVLHEFISQQPADADEPPCYDVEALSPELKLVADLAEHLAARVRRVGAPPAEAAPELLSRQPFALQLAVRRIASALQFRAIERLTAMQIATLLRGRSPDVLRVCLDAPDDLSTAEKAAALAEPLLTPAGSDEEPTVGVGSEDELAIAGALSELDARSLRALKAVSRVWRRRARLQLGDGRSAWRAAPEWSAGGWAVEWFGTRLASDSESLRKRALLGLDALEAAVELPQFAPQLVESLAAGELSSVRSLALRHLSRMEPETLALFADGIRPALAGLEPHEAAAAGTELLVQKLSGEASAGAPPEATAGSSSKRKRAGAALAAGDLRHRIAQKI